MKKNIIAICVMPAGCAALTWVTFRTHIDWTVYGNEAETIVKPGMLDVPIAPLPYVTIWQDMLKGNEDELKKMKKNPFSDYS